MALVNITDAAKLVRKARTTLVRDIETGRLAKTVLQDGDVRVDTAELLRTYGRLHSPQTAPQPREARKISADKTRVALLEERIRSLERVIALEAELRRVKDQVTTELRIRLADKDHMIKILESKILFLEYDKQTLQTRPVPTLEPEEALHPAPAPASVPAPASAPPSASTPTPVHPSPADSAMAATPSAAAAPVTPAPAPSMPSATATPKSAAHGSAESGQVTAPSKAAASHDPGAPGKGKEQAAAPATPTPAFALPSAATDATATSSHTATGSARSAQSAPGGLERRRPPKTRGWWKRLFGRREPHGH